MVRQRICSVPQRHRLKIDSTVFASEVVGSGQPLVLLHGLGGSSRWWARNWRALARQHELHMLDLAGCGQSGGRFVLAEAADMLATWLQRLGLGRAHFLGHSMGGSIALDLAAKHPDRVDKLILADAAISFGSANGRLAHAPEGPQRVFPLSMLPVVVPDALRAGIFTMVQVARELIARDMSATIARLQAQTLLLWGENDLAVPLSVAREITRRKPSIPLAIIEDAGHVPMWEQPFLFNRVVADFLAGRPLKP